MKKQDLMNIKTEDLSSKLDELKKELFHLKSATLAGEDSMKKKAKMVSVKKDIARIKTRLNE